MCRTTAAPLLALMGVAGTAAGVGFAVVRERLDRISDLRAAKEATDAANSKSSSDSSDSEESRNDS